MEHSSSTEPGDRWPPTEKGKSLPGAGRFGMILFLISLSVGFLSVLGAYLVFRVRGGADWLPEGAPGLPPLLWVSTALLLGCSATAHGSLIAARRDRHRALTLTLFATLVLAVVFTACQGLAWRDMAELQDRPGMRLYAVTFYLLTGLHALHVVGGLGLQLWVLVRASLGHYWSLYHPGVEYSALYWHFLDGAWLVLFGVIWFGSRA